MRIGHKRAARCERGASLWWWVALALALMLASALARTQSAGQLARIKDVASIEGIRDNQLVGYGLVVGCAAPGTARRQSFRRRR